MKCSSLLQRRSFLPQAASPFAHITQQSFSEHIKSFSEKEVESVLFYAVSPRCTPPNRAAFFTKPYGKWILGSNAAAAWGNLKEGCGRGDIASWHQCGRAKCFLPFFLRIFCKPERGDMATRTRHVGQMFSRFLSDII